MKMVSKKELLDYAIELQKELDGFFSHKGHIHHRICIERSEFHIRCCATTIEVDKKFEIDGDNIVGGSFSVKQVLREAKGVRQGLAQMVYTRYGMRLYTGRTVCLYKTERRLCWTKMQAEKDAASIIAQACLSGMTGGRE